MVNNKRNLLDLSIISNDSEYTILGMIDRCQTYLGSKVLKEQLYKSPQTLDLLKAQQDVVKFWYHNPTLWANEITNGTIIMVEKFFESAESISSYSTPLFSSKWFQRTFQKNEYHFISFSISHLSDFVKGCFSFIKILEMDIMVPILLLTILEEIKELLAHNLCSQLLSVQKGTTFKELTQLSFKVQRELKSTVHKMMQLYARLDAWYSMASATKEHGWCFAELLPQEQTCLEAVQLYHPLLTNSVCYDLSMSKYNNFIILTGANMSGKTTLMRSLGIAVILTHLGMGVPAQNFKLSFVDAVLTNMLVEDNIIKGESYFMAEVKSIKKTIETVISNNSCFLLMDELFKGTNVHDAYECTKAIAEGLLNFPNNLMILSTHLHEVAYYFKSNSQLSFYCFSTKLNTDGSFNFDYKLKKGISDERIGYKILVNEGIVAMLNKQKI